MQLSNQVRGGEGGGGVKNALQRCYKPECEIKYQKPRTNFLKYEYFSPNKYYICMGNIFTFLGKASYINKT